MARIPESKYTRVRDWNTDKQRRVMNAVEELYPEWELQEIANLTQEDIDELGERGEKLEPIDVHPSTVTRTMREFMAPEGEEEFETEGPAKWDVTPNVPDQNHVQEFLDGYVQGSEKGFMDGVEWAERVLDLPKGALTDRVGRRNTVDAPEF